MPSGRCGSIAELPSSIRSLLDTEGRGVMSTKAADGGVHSVPVVFAVVGAEIVSPIDHKPKSGTVMARMRNIERDPRLTLLVDHWEQEEWERLAWVMVRGRAEVDESRPRELLRALNARYEQYETDEHHDALIRIKPTRLSWWAWTLGSPAEEGVARPQDGEPQGGGTERDQQDLGPLSPDAQEDDG